MKNTQDHTHMRLRQAIQILMDYVLANKPYSQGKDLRENAEQAVTSEALTASHLDAVPKSSPESQGDWP